MGLRTHHLRRTTSTWEWQAVACPADSSPRTESGGSGPPDSSGDPECSEEVHADCTGAGFARPRQGTSGEPNLRLIVSMSPHTAQRCAGCADVATRKYAELDTAHRAVPPDADRRSGSSRRQLLEWWLHERTRSLYENAVRVVVTNETPPRPTCLRQAPAQDLRVRLRLLPRGEPPSLVPRHDARQGGTSPEVGRSACAAAFLRTRGPPAR